MAGAQGTSMQDVTVWAGKGYAGIYGGDGSGGSNINVNMSTHFYVSAGLGVYTAQLM